MTSFYLSADQIHELIPGISRSCAMDLATALKGRWLGGFMDGDRIAIRIRPDLNGLVSGRRANRALSRLIGLATSRGGTVTITANALTIVPPQSSQLPVPTDGLIADLTAAFPDVPREELAKFAPIFAGFMAKYADFLAISLEPGGGDRPGSLMLTPRTEIGTLMGAIAETAVAEAVNSDD